MIGEFLGGSFKGETRPLRAQLGLFESRPHAVVKRIHSIGVDLEIRPDSGLQHFAGSAIRNVGRRHLTARIP